MEIRISPEAALGGSPAVAPPRAPSVPPVPPPPAVANISPFGDLLGKLRELSDISPDAFRRAAQQIEAGFQQAAAGPATAEAGAAAELAARFHAVSEAGNLSPLQQLSAESARSVSADRAMAEASAQAVPHVEQALRTARGEG